MRNATINFGGLEIQVYHAQVLPSGYGHKSIEVELYYNEEYKKFKGVTDNMPGYDVASDLEGEEKYIALYELIAFNIEDEVFDWVDSL